MLQSLLFTSVILLDGKVISLAIFLGLKGTTQKTACKSKNIYLEYQIRFACPWPPCYVAAFIIWSDYILELSSCILVFWFRFFPLHYTHWNVVSEIFTPVVWNIFCVMWTQSQFMAISSWFSPILTYPYIAGMDTPSSWIVSCPFKPSFTQTEQANSLSFLLKISPVLWSV